MRPCCWIVAAILVAPVALRAGVALTVDAAGVEASQVPGVTTETFDSFATGDHTTLVTAVGTLTATSPGFNIHANDQYGGANTPSATGNYMAVGEETTQSTNTTLSAVLSLTGPVSYLGLYLGSVDTGDTLSLYSGGTGGTLVASYTYTDFSTAIGPDSGSSAAYYQNENPPGGPIQAFAYLNFTASDATTFDTVVFGNDFTGGGTEVDNISVLPAAAVPLPPGAVIAMLMLALAAAAALARAQRSCPPQAPN
jgi:hypothetical protein